MQRHVFQPIQNITTLDFESAPIVKKKQGRDVIEYYNIPCSYDIETSSFRSEQGKPVALTYSHALNLDGYCFKMEYWEHFQETMDYIADRFKTGYTRRLVIYIHHLAYEFDFLKTKFNFVKVFSNGGERKVLTALTDKGIEFRCSYMLSGYNLEKTAKNLLKYPVKKMVGQLDFDKLRTPLTPIDDQELEYILNDVLIIENFIREAMEENGDITKIPLTSTGYVRRHTLERTIKGPQKEAKRYRELIRALTVEVEEYNALRHAFGGGFTHANIKHVGQTKENVDSFDFASSYPARMIQKKFPMSKGEVYFPKDNDDFHKQMDLYCTLFYIELKGVTRKANEGYISAYKSLSSSYVTTNNGRVENAARIELWMTELDFECTMLSYDIEEYKVHQMYRYKAGYLPTPLIKVVTELYENKTKYKNVKGKESEYNRSKEMINSVYGMCVQDIAQDNFEWDDLRKTSEKQPLNLEETIEKYNKSRKRFLFYPWGVWITAHARAELFRDVVKLEDDYIYADTDSAKLQNLDKHKHIFEESNERIIEELYDACVHHGIDYSVVSPKDPSGKTRTIGVWEHEGTLDKFRTLGAKRYMVEEDGEINITVSGVNKSKAVPYLKDTYDDPFEAFKEGLTIPAGFCGKNTHTYMPEPVYGTIRDYNGVPYEYEAESGVHLEKTFYSMHISDEFKELIEFIKERPSE